MIILDANVISEPMNPKPNPGVVEWLNRQNANSLHATAITIMELRYGIERLPEGRRKADLWKQHEFFLSRMVGSRIIPFDQSAAVEAARIGAHTEKIGRTMGHAEAMIAAIALTRGFAVATRDTRPFVDAGAKVIDPFLPSNHVKPA